MFWMRSFLNFFLAFSCIVLPLFAQNRQEAGWKYLVELSGEVAHGRFYHGDHLLGKGLDYGGGIGIRPFSGRLKGLGFEVRISRFRDNQSSANISSSLYSRFIAVNALYHFRSGTKAQPFVYGGIGNVKEEYSYSCMDCVFVPDPVTGELVSIPQQWHDSGNKNGLILGGGVKIAVHRHLSIRPEILLADTTLGSGPNWSWCRFQIGLGVHY